MSFHLPATNRAGAMVLRNAGRLILHRGHRRCPAHAWRGALDHTQPMDVATAMCLARFGVFPSVGRGHKTWRLQDNVYSAAYEPLLEYLLEFHRSDVCGWNARVTNARVVIGTLYGVAEAMWPGPQPLVRGRRVPTRVRVEAWTAWIAERAAHVYPRTGDDLVVVPDHVPAEWLEEAAA